MQYFELEIELDPSEKDALTALNESKLFEQDIFIYNGDIYPDLHKAFRRYVRA